MDSNITIKIVEPGSGPIDPVVPNTGLFTNGIGGPETAIIAISAVILLAAIIAAVLYYRKKKQGKVDSLSTLLKTLLNSTKHKKATTIGLVVLALLVSAGTFTALIKNAVQAAISDIPESSEASETTSQATVEDGELVVELGDTPVFAYIPTTITVDEEMPAGYTLKAYSANPTLSSEGTDKTISIIPPANTTTETSELQDNTWGLATEEPISQTQQIFYSLPETADEAIVIKSIDDYSSTPAGDTTTVYYGVYITPDMPYGTYSGATVSYDVEPIMTSATVVFDGNDKFYFNGDTTATTNTMEYVPGNQSAPQYSHTPNVNDEGVQTEGEMYPLDSNETFVYEFTGVDNVYVDVVETGNDSGCGPNQDDYFSIWSGAHADFTAKANWETALSLNGSNGKNVFDNNGKYDGAGVNVEGDAVTIAYTTNTERQSYCPMTGYGYYAKVIGYNPNIATGGEYEVPTTDGAYRFLGWSEDAAATTPTYKSAADIERALSLTTGETITLYAISEPGIVITYNGNGADTTTNMDNVEQYTTNVESTSTVDLLASNFTKEGYGFVGWSTDQNAWNDLTDADESNNPTIYGPNQTITVDPSVYNKLALYAVWAPAETDNSGNPIALQDWQGCSSLAPTAYDSQTGALNVSNNTITALTDSRDGNIYTVARLADGNCWMTENLRLDNEPELSQQNTNNPSLPLTNNYAEQITSNKLSPSSNDWCIDYNSAPCFNQSKLNTDNTMLTVVSPVFSQDFTNQVHKNFDVNINFYGNYYNWYSATAGNGKQETGSGTTVAGDICPVGWFLPYGGDSSGVKGGNTSGGFYYLNQQMGGSTSSQGSNNLRSFPNNFIYSGNWFRQSAYGSGNYGMYWSSTVGRNASNDSADMLDIGNSYESYNWYPKSRGFSVRCVASVR